MKKPVLVVMAAGMGSRYGGLKQIDPVDDQGHIIMDFSVYDAVRAGFEEVVFIIKRENEEDFRAVIGDRVSRYIKVTYVFQELHNLPDGFSVPEGRVKPWGTGHAVLSCLGTVDAPMVVINADDFYGRQAFEKAFAFLTNGNESTGRYMMVGYRLENTLTEHGSVARGICQTNVQDELVKITERTCIERHGEEIVFTEDGGRNWTVLEADTTVSLNMWGFSSDILVRLQEKFCNFLNEHLEKNPLKCEYFLPFVVDELLREGRASVKVMKSSDKWYGVTYKEDKPLLIAAIQKMKDHGEYPQAFFE